MVDGFNCPRCGATNWQSNRSCKNCRLHFEVLNQPVPEPSFQAAEMPFGMPVPLKSGLAIASMVLGIVGLVTSFLLIGFVLAIIGLVLGISALSQTKRLPHIYGGYGFAVAGIVTSSVTLFLLIPIVAAVAIPSLLASKRAAEESSAISSLRTISSAQSTYRAVFNTENCVDLQSLASQNLIDSALATGAKGNYAFEINVSPKTGTCEMFATPNSKSGYRSFMIGEDLRIRGGDKKGNKAEITDPPVAN